MPTSVSKRMVIKLFRVSSLSDPLINLIRNGEHFTLNTGQLYYKHHQTGIISPLLTTVTSLDWSLVTSKPTTITGFGISIGVNDLPSSISKSKINFGTGASLASVGVTLASADIPQALTVDTLTANTDITTPTATATTLTATTINNTTFIGDTIQANHVTIPNTRTFAELANSDVLSKEEVITYVQQSVSSGLTVLDEGVLVATTEDIALFGLQTIDSVVLTDGNRVLVKNQTDKIQNGIYIASSDAWIRALDMDDSAEVRLNTFVFVDSGITQENSSWVITGDADPVITVDNINFSQFSGSQVFAVGAGLEKNGNTISIKGAMSTWGTIPAVNILPNSVIGFDVNNAPRFLSAPNFGASILATNNIDDAKRILKIENNDYVVLSFPVDTDRVLDTTYYNKSIIVNWTTAYDNNLFKPGVFTDPTQATRAGLKIPHQTVNTNSFLNAPVGTSIVIKNAMNPKSLDSYDVPVIYYDGTINPYLTSPFVGDDYFTFGNCVNIKPNDEVKFTILPNFKILVNRTSGSSSLNRNIPYRNALHFDEQEPIDRGRVLEEINRLSNVTNSSVYGGTAPFNGYHPTLVESTYASPSMYATYTVGGGGFPYGWKSVAYDGNTYFTEYGLITNFVSIREATNANLSKSMSHLSADPSIQLDINTGIAGRLLLTILRNIKVVFSNRDIDDIVTIPRGHQAFVDKKIPNWLYLERDRKANTIVLKSTVCVPRYMHNFNRHASTLDSGFGTFNMATSEYQDETLARIELQDGRTNKGSCVSLDNWDYVFSFKNTSQETVDKYWIAYPDRLTRTYIMNELKSLVGAGQGMGGSPEGGVVQNGNTYSYAIIREPVTNDKCKIVDGVFNKALEYTGEGNILDLNGLKIKRKLLVADAGWGGLWTDSGVSQIRTDHWHVVSLWIKIVPFSITNTSKLFGAINIIVSSYNDCTLSVGYRYDDPLSLGYGKFDYLQLNIPGARYRFSISGSSNPQELANGVPISPIPSYNTAWTLYEVSHIFLMYKVGETPEIYLNGAKLHLLAVFSDNYGLTNNTLLVSNALPIWDKFFTAAVAYGEFEPAVVQLHEASFGDYLTKPVNYTYPNAYMTGGKDTAGSDYDDRPKIYDMDISGSKRVVYNNQKDFVVNTFREATSMVYNLSDYNWWRTNSGAASYALGDIDRVFIGRTVSPDSTQDMKFMFFNQKEEFVFSNIQNDDAIFINRANRIIIRTNIGGPVKIRIFAKLDTEDMEVELPTNYSDLDTTVDNGSTPHPDSIKMRATTCRVQYNSIHGEYIDLRLGSVPVAPPSIIRSSSKHSLNGIISNFLPRYTEFSVDAMSTYVQYYSVRILVERDY